MSLYEHKNGISFKKVDREDLEQLLSLKNESHFGTHTVTLANSISQEKWLESISTETHCPRQLVLVAKGLIKGKDLLAVIHNEDLYSKIGVFKILNIDWQNRKAEAGWDVYKPYRGKGLGKKLVEAGVAFSFNILNLRRLDAQILVTNTASMKCAVAAGFTTEGRQSKAIFKNGEYVDNILLGIMKNE